MTQLEIYLFSVAAILIVAVCVTVWRVAKTGVRVEVEFVVGVEVGKP